MRELTLTDLDQVDGAVSSDTAYSVAVGVATALALGAVGAAAIPIAAVGIGILAGGSIISSGLAIYYAMQ